MPVKFVRRIFYRFGLASLLIAALVVPAAQAQNMGTGALNITVQDPSGRAVDGAKIVLKDLETNDVHRSVTKGQGTSVIPYLNPAHYSLTISKEGFSDQEYPSITIQTNQVTPLNITLALGVATQKIEVSGSTSPILDTTQNTIATTLDLKQVQDLPLGGRDTFSLAFLVPGAVGNNINNYPGGAVNVSGNGFSLMTNRNKSAGFDDDGSVTSNRLESVQEMTVQSGELDASKGGTSAMDIAFTTKRGTNQYHGQLFWDYRNDSMNANSWYNNAVGQPRSKLIINDFGAAVGGPILKDKLFFFASLANLRRPSKSTISTTVGTPAALSGVYEYQGTNGVESINVLQAGASAGCATCTGAINPIIAQDLANIESTYTAQGATLTPVDLNHESLHFQDKGYLVQKFPTLRLDYNISQNLRWMGLATETNNYHSHVGGPPYPGPLYANQAYSNQTRNYQIATGFDWTIKPDLVNAFRVGYLYTSFIYNTQGINTPTDDMVQQGDLAFGFGLNSGVNGFNSLKGGSLYPVLSINDGSTWQYKSHTFSFGVQASTEIDHYYNNQFVPYVGVDSISSGDPVQDALDSAVPADAPGSAAGDVEGLYATLTGRMTYYSLGQFVNAKTKEFAPGQSFNLHERLTQSALYFEDSWRATRSLTLNYGLRWDFTGASKDETGFYTHPSIGDLWGPSGVGNLFKPGTLTGNMNPVEGPHAYAYAATYVHPEPNFGFAWNPQGASDTWLGRLLGDGTTVVRGSFSFKNYTEGAQNFWNFGSNNGANFNTYFYADPVAPVPGVTPGSGFYNAGSVILGGPLPGLTSTSPNPFQSVIPLASQTFSGTGYLTFNPHIKQPYVESWQFGIQRSLNKNSVLEVRYVGNVAKAQWLAENYNEVNIYENGFLKDFQAAQANLAASDPNNPTFQGANPTPLLDAAFATSGPGPYSDGGFITDLRQGQAGAMASSLAGNPTYLCSMVGANNFGPCAANGIPGTGSYPINVFQANPYAAGAGIFEMTNDGYSNYNALQVDFRQRPTHGMQFDVNYTLSHSLGTSVQGSTAPGYYGGGGNNAGGGASGNGNSAPGFYTLRNKQLNYFPSSFDVRNVLHLSGTYDLPFGHGRMFFNQNKLANETIGGWTLGTILTYESGDPLLFNGGTETVNGNDSGIALNGVTPSELQKQIRIRPSTSGQPWKNLFDSKYYASDGHANPQYITPQYTAGQFGHLLWLHNPKWINTDMALTKVIPIHDALNLSLQGEFLNVFNHVAWAGMDTSVQSNTFGTTNGTKNSPRNIEVRANFQF